MRRLLLCFTIGITISAQLVSPQDKILVPAGFLTGQGFLELTENEQLWATTGAIDGLLGSTQFGAPLSNVQKLRDCLQGKNKRQVVAMVQKYTKDQPELWHAPFSVFVAEAMARGCPYTLK
jgi:hypothetical protein